MLGFWRSWKNSLEVARPERFELPTLGFEVRCSIQLSYGRLLLFRWAGRGAGLFRHHEPLKATAEIFSALSIIRDRREGLLMEKTRPVTRTGKVRETACWNAEAQQWAIPWTPAIRMKTGARSLSRCSRFVPSRESRAWPNAVSTRTFKCRSGRRHRIPSSRAGISAPAEYWCSAARDYCRT